MSEIYALFLDDERFPPRDSRNWVIARSCDEAMALIREKGIPRFISFDHDLGRDQKTGKDFANELIAWCMDNGWPGFSWYTHSMNPVGRVNIDELIGQYMVADKPTS